MPSPGDRYAFELSIAKQASQHWLSEEKSRGRKIEARDHGHLVQTETKARIEKQIDYLRDRIRKVSVPGDPVSDNLEAMLESGEALVEHVDPITLERVIGETRDFLAIEFLEGALEASRSVGRIVTNLGGGRRSFGTGFLVAPGLLMTNWHVLKTADAAGRSVVEFNYQRDRLGNPLSISKFSVRPDLFFLADKDFDFALVAIEGGAALDQFGYRPLNPREGKILIGDPINIIQHPRGEMKQIVVRENRLLDLPAKPHLDKYAHYAADTEPGSSGSPVFNDLWDVVALHHSGVPNADSNGRILDIDGNVWVEGRDDPARIHWIGNEGIRVSRLVTFVGNAKVQEHEKPIRDSFIAVGTNPAGAPRFPPAVSSGFPDAKEGKADAPVPVADPVMRSDDTVEVTIPITIRARVGAPRRPASAAAGGPATSSYAAGRHLGSGVTAPPPPPAELSVVEAPEAFPSAYAPTADPRVVELLFATNRKPDMSAEGAFSAERNNNVLTYGAVGVRVPEEHRLGRLELPRNLSILSLTLYNERVDRRRHFVVDSISTIPVKQWRESLASWGADDALIFVHGFNTSFEQALYRNAQIVWDLQFRGVPILFSWPSRGRMLDYGYDRNSALAAPTAFLKVIRLVAREPTLKRIHILAHSMGNLVVLEALSSLGRSAKGIKLGQLLMAAPDIDRDHYRGMAAGVRKTVAGMTLYASAADKALAVSKRLAGNIARAGDVPIGGPIVLPDIDSIDMTAIGDELLGHATYAQQRSVLNDVALAILGRRPPHTRLVEIRGVPEGSESPLYWRFGS